MGILSRKMAMPAQLASNPIHYKEVLVPAKSTMDPKKYDSRYLRIRRLLPKVDLFNPVLGGKSYTGERHYEMAHTSSVHNDKQAVHYS